MRRIAAFLIPFIALATYAFPAHAQFATGFTIVPQACHSCPAAWSCVLDLINNLVTLAMSLGVLIVILVIAYAGFLLLLTPTNPENRSQASKMLINAVIGLIIVLAAWLIVDKILEVLGAGQFDSVEGATGVLGSGGAECIVAGPGFNPGGANPPSGTPGDPIAGTPGCPTCVSLTQSGLTCKTSTSCTADPELVARLVALNADFGSDWTVTEGYPPTRTHRAACHYQGTCVDAGFRGISYTEANAIRFAESARRSGLRAVFETGTNPSLVEALKQAGYEALYLPGWVTGDHFSVYGN